LRAVVGDAAEKVRIRRASALEEDFFCSIESGSQLRRIFSSQTPTVGDRGEFLLFNRQRFATEEDFFFPNADRQRSRRISSVQSRAVRN